MRQLTHRHHSIHVRELSLSLAQVVLSLSPRGDVAMKELNVQVSRISAA